MRGTRTWAVVGALCALGQVSEARAARPGPRDYFLDPPAAGLWANFDAFTLGAQGSLEHRLELDGDLTMLTTRLSALGSLGYADLGAHADFRVAMVTFGGSVGYRQVWRNYEAPSGEVTYKNRLKIDRGELDGPSFDRNSKGWMWGEARARAVVPLEHLWLVTNAAVRWEGAPDQSYDWFHTNVHDGTDRSLLWKADATLFVRHERYGAVGPTVRFMRLPRQDKASGHLDEVAFGFTLGTRPGWKRKTDLFLLQFLAAPGNDEFGFHVTRAPIYAMLIYRMSFALSVPDRPY